MFSKLWAKVAEWAAIAGAVALAIVAALFYGWKRGGQQQKGEDLAAAAQKAIEEANATQKAVRDHQEVQNEVNKLPDAPAQNLGNAKPGTAAGELHRWLRDVSDHDSS